jgi:flagellar biosynthesis component FlhA
VQLHKVTDFVEDAGHPPVVIASPPVRAVVRQIVEPHMSSIVVLGYNEIVAGIDVESMGLIMPPPQDVPQQTAA